MIIHSSILVWRIPWTKEAGMLQPIGSHKQTLLEQLNMHVYLNKAGRGFSRKKKCSLKVELLFSQLAVSNSLLIP